MTTLPEIGPMASINIKCSQCDRMKVGESYICNSGECDVDLCDACANSLIIETLKWSWYGTRGNKPDVKNNYAGLIIYDPGSFKWKEKLRPGYSIIMDFKELKFD